MRKLILSAAGLLASVATLKAEPVLDRALASAQILDNRGCAILKIAFNFRVQYVGHFPQQRSDELRVSVRAIDRAQAAALALLRREALRAPESKTAVIKAIEFELMAGAEPVLRIQFANAVTYQVAQGQDFESIVVAISGAAQSPDCRPVFPRAADGGWGATVARDPQPSSSSAVAPRSKARGAGTTSAADLRAIAGWMDKSRAAMRKGNAPTAVPLLTKILKFPENEHSSEAQELLGLARQKMGQIAEARAEYDDYVTRYPQGEGHERVQQRLAGIITAATSPGDSLRKSNAQEGTGSRGPYWSVSGSVSQFFIRDDSFRVIRDPTLPPDPNPDPDAHRVHQNALLSSFDLSAAWGNDQMKSKFRFSGTEEHSFNAGDKEIVGIAALYGETSIRSLDMTARLGRQTRNAGGVLGRFDGGIVSWQGTPWARVNVVAGSPVLSRKDLPFKDDKYFVGASLDFGPFLGGLETSIFAIEQRDRKLLDRQAIGTEIKYFDQSKSAFATIDYDVHFRQLNAAIFSGSATLSDKSTVHAGIDYRKSPYLSAWTALQGQPFLTLYDMLKLHTKEEIDQLAIDRSATFKSANFGYARPISETLQISFDATATNVAGTIASGNIDAMPGTGTEYYYSGQLTGTNFFAPGDMYIVGLRFADLHDSNLYALDLNARYPLTSDLRINPRMRFGYRKGDTSDLRELTFLPSLLLNYYWTKELSLELEVGAKWTRRDQGGVQDRDTELFLTAGFRYDFYADGKSKCAPVSINCR